MRKKQINLNKNIIHINLFVQTNFELLDKLSRLCIPKSNCNKANYENYSIELIFSKIRNVRLMFTRQLIFFFLRKDGMNINNIAELFSLHPCTVGPQLRKISFYINTHATSKEIEIIKELDKIFNS